MKSRALIVAACLLAVGIVSCGKKTEEPKADSTATTTAPMDTTATPDTTAKSMDTVKSPADTMVLKSNDSLTKKDSMPKGKTDGAKSSSKSTSKTDTKTSSKSSTSTPATPESHESTPRRSSGTPSSVESKPRR